VTNLNESGPGSFREAVSQGSRTVVFDVGGEIHLTGPIFVRGPFTTIDGATAPAPGITLTNYGLYLHGNKDARDVVVRGIAVRNSAGDGVQVKFGAYNIVIDHVSVSGSRDGNLDITRDSHDVTVSWSIFAEPVGTVELHSKNVLIKYNPSRITLHHNLFVKGAERNPQVRIDDLGTPAIDTTADIRNNLVWDWNGGYGTKIWYGPRANVVANFYSSPESASRGQAKALIVLASTGARAYVAGNVSGDPLGLDINAPGTEASPFPVPVVTTTDACRAASAVLANAGRRPLDVIDQGYLSAITLLAQPSCGDEPPGGGGDPSELPDLKVSTLNAPPSAPVGQTFKVSTTILNSGSGPAAATKVRIYLSTDGGLQRAVALKTTRVRPLAPGATASVTTKVTIPAGIQPGTHYLVSKANPDGVVSEVSGANNTATLPLTVSPR
jgi:hypothetical protein